MMIINALICSLTMLFIHAVTWEGNLLHKPANWFEMKFPLLSKPIFGCLTCMAVYWGLLADVIFFHYYDRTLILFLGSIGGFNVLLATVIGHYAEKNMFDDETV